MRRTTHDSRRRTRDSGHRSPVTGLVFDISRGCVDDGPGYRTVVFLKGCALDCPWCHNPEGKSFSPEIAFDAAKCIGCRAREAACPRRWIHDPRLTTCEIRPTTHDVRLRTPDSGLRTSPSVASRQSSVGSQPWRTGCTACGGCVEACPSGARRLAGKAFSVEDLVGEVMADAPFFAGTGGGVTFSGGEPMARPDFLFACARQLRTRGVHVAAETAGFFAPRLAKRLAREADLVLFDLKHADAEKFRGATGKDISAVLENFKTILASNVPVELRLTLVPGFNDSAADLKTIGGFLKDMPGVPPVALLPFHRLATSKQSLFDRRYPYAEAAPVTKEGLETARRILERVGIEIA